MIDVSVGRYVLIIVAACGALVSQALMKHGLNQGEPITVANLGQFVALFHRILTTPALLLGYVLSFGTGLIWLVILSRLNLSYAVPMMSATYFILVLLTSALVLREVVTTGQWIGTMLIVAGMFLIARFG